MVSTWTKEVKNDNWSLTTIPSAGHLDVTGFKQYGQTAKALLGCDNYRAAVEKVLKHVWEIRVPLVILAPPGSGKSCQ